MATVYAGPKTIVGNYNPAFNIPQSNDLNALRPIEVSQLFGQAVTAGDRVINSIKADILAGNELRVQDARVHVSVTTPLIASPHGQPLMINAGNSVVNFGGATIVNAGGIAGDPNVYDLIGTVTTVDATPTIGLVIPVVSGSYSFTAQISCVDANVPSVGGYILLTGGGRGVPVAVSTPYFSRKRQASPALNAIDALFGVSGASACVKVVGMAGVTINWRVKVSIVRVLP